MSIFGTVSVALGVAVSSYGKSLIQTVVAGMGVVSLISILGGAWGASPSAGILRNLSKLTPVYWAMDAVQMLMGGKQLVDLVMNLAVILCMATVLLLLGIWRKADVAK